MQFLKYGLFIGGFGASVIGVPLLIKDWKIKKFKPEKKNYSDKTVVITGATSGIGYKVAEEMSKLQAKVVMLCRDEAKCIQLRRRMLNNTKNGKVFCSKVDFESMNSVKECAERLNKALSKIDVLVNCAGVMRIQRKSLTDDRLETHLSVNHFAHFLLTNLLMDKLKASDDARILNITCQDYKKAKPLDFSDLNLLKSYTGEKAYRQSKLANVLFTKQLAYELKNVPNVNVFAVRADRCNTPLKRHLSYYNNFFLSLVPSAIHFFFEYTLPQVVETIKYAALEPSLKDKAKSGICINNCAEEECKLYEGYRADAKKLWLVSEKWSRLKESDDL